MLTNGAEFALLQVFTQQSGSTSLLSISERFISLFNFTLRSLPAVLRLFGSSLVLHDVSLFCSGSSDGHLCIGVEFCCLFSQRLKPCGRVTHAFQSCLEVGVVPDLLHACPSLLHRALERLETLKRLRLTLFRALKFSRELLLVRFTACKPRSCACCRSCATSSAWR